MRSQFLMSRKDHPSVPCTMHFGMNAAVLFALAGSIRVRDHGRTQVVEGSRGQFTALSVPFSNRFPETSRLS